jgi:O-antigen/teichoic acid export membrane protein
MTKTLKEKTINAAIWSTIERFGQQGLKFIVTIILARLLGPYEFGLIGMITIFITVSEIFVNSGLGVALIQKKNTDDKDFSTVFYFNLLVSIILYLVLYFSSPLISRFYSEPKLILITRVLTLIIIINAFSTIHLTKLKKILNFKKITKVSIISSVLSGVIGITLALSNFGIWSLVFYHISYRLFRAILFWVYDNWHPSFEFSIMAFKDLFNYSSKLLLSALLNRFFIDIYNVIIGKFFSAASLGFYDRAKKLQMLALRNLSATTQAVTFPALSLVQDDKERLQRGYRKIFEMAAFINFSIMSLMIVIAKPLIILLLTDKWIQVIPYLQLLCIVGITYPLQALNLNVLKVKGRSDLFLLLEIIKKVFIIIAIVIGYRYGIEGLIIGQIITSIISYFINSYFSGKFIDFSTSKQIYTLFPYLMITSIVGVFIFILTNMLFNTNILLLTSQIVGFVIITIVAAKLFKLRAYFEVKEILISVYIKKFRRN